METHRKKHAEEMELPCKVSTLPIRNGNGLIGSPHCRVPAVSTLPIRNGNHELIHLTSPPFLSSKYLTYKEWKLIVRMTTMATRIVSTLPIRNGNLNILIELTA